MRGVSSLKNPCCLAPQEFLTTRHAGDHWATPQSYHRHLPGSARNRPQSGKPQFNPITGEEIVYTPTPRAEFKTAPVNNKDTSSVPSLNLKYLKDDDIKTGAIDIDLNDYSLDTPGSASTVSWGTARSGRNFQPPQSMKSTTSRTSFRPEGVPGLSLDDTKPASARKPVKQPTAWDKDPVPDNVPAPSARQRQMFQQYADEMKQSYREYTAAKPNKVTEEEVNQAVERIRSARQAVQQQEQKLTAGQQNDPEDIDNTDTFSDSWTQQRYLGKQLLKKKDAEDLLEHNKKQKLVETVMVDQLSRAVISNPEQDDRITQRPTSTRLSRGSNRLLHDSKVRTSASATENLLSKRVRFGARILTQNGHDAMKELTGFYFGYDKTITVYEFRKFGKSAKAMPFIYRGQYCHSSGPKQGLPYSLSDIYPGSNLKIKTEGQLALTDTLAEKDFIVLRVTDVDESEKETLIDEQDESERLHQPSKLDVENREFLYMIQAEVQDQIRKRGIRTITGLGRFYRKLDVYKTGILDQYDLEKGLKTFRINLDPQHLEDVFEILDPEGMKMLDYVDFLHGIVGEMSEYRKIFVRKAFQKLDSSRKGVIHISDVSKFFNVNAKYKPVSGAASNVSALQAFLEDVRESAKQDVISYTEFEEYYEGLSISLPSDEDFVNVLRNTWNV
ncbi:calcyphosin-2-like [Plakobranchus ocellatus]|uniref:Calcyphosin-2-like n=1 Tax=Plakobranchus ocellatus TaxID=259542 RepID=A0AAV4D7W1_9GAST|nr:calcyphosin-2-like [Plakobranchus ocellatus]